MLLRVIALLFLLQHGLNGNQIVDHVVVSKLNEPLSINLSFDLSKAEDSDLSIKLASKNRYQQYGIERPKLLDGIKISHIESKTDSKKKKRMKEKEEENNRNTHKNNNNIVMSY